MLRVIEEHLGSKQVSRVVYGSIIGIAVVVTLEAHPPSTGAIIGTLLGTAIAVALAELYSDIIGIETREHRRVGRRGWPRIAADVSGVAIGIGFPAIFFLLSALGVFDVDTAFVIAKWSGLALVGFYGYCGARLAGESLLSALIHATAVAVIGGFLIALKAVVH